MPKSSSGRASNASDLSASKSDRRRRDPNENDDDNRTRNRTESTTSSSSKRKSSRRDEIERDDGYQPTSTDYSSSSRSPYAGGSAPSIASSYATAYTAEPTNAPTQDPSLVRNESVVDKTPRSSRSDRKETRRDSRRDSRRESKGESNRGLDDRDDDESKNAERLESGKEKPKRDSAQSQKERRESVRGNTDENHKASLVQNQFPGEFPGTFAEPYRPPGLAADYYGDHGESVQYQPGVRPQPPAIIESAEYAHLHEPTVEAKPPPEPSSLGQLGAAASFYAMADESDVGEMSTPSKPPKISKPARKDSLAPTVHSNVGASPRSSPGPDGRIPMRNPALPSGGGGSSSGGAGIGLMGSAAMATGVGLAADYYGGNIPITGPNETPLGSSNQTGQNYAQSQTTYHTAQTDTTYNTAQASSRPQRPSIQQSSGSNVPLYGAAAAAGLAGVAGVAAASAYNAHHNHSGQQQQQQQQQQQFSQAQDGSTMFVPGQNQSAFPEMQQRHRHKHRGPFGMMVDWFRDPQAVAEYEQYTEAIGVCKYCFDPNSSPLDAPRKHHYKPRRYSGGRYGSSTRVDKLTRYSSDEERRRRSTTKKVLATGLAAAGAAKIGEAIYNQRNNFDDTYSVKSGRPPNSSRVSFKEDEETKSSTRRKKYSETADVRVSRSDSTRKSRQDGEVYEKRSSRRRDSSASDHTSRISRGAALSTGIAAAGITAGALAGSDRRRSSRSRSSSPTKRKKYYSKRISPRHSYVDLSTTNSGPLGFGGFFSSPSANARKGKKSKGFFNFANGSSSSSDADLIFGEGTVRRKSTKRTEKKKKDDGGGISTAAILGLAVTGAALAAESGKKESKGRRKTDGTAGRESLSQSADRRTSRKSTENRQSDERVNEEWEDASDDGSVDSGLIYGGERLSAMQSRESLASNDGTTKWNWRWNKKNDEKEKKRRTSSRPESSGFNPVVAGLAGAATGAAIGAMSQSPALTSNSSLPPMQYLDPVATSDSTYFDARNASVVSGVSPRSSGPIVSTPSIPLQQPQPIAQVSSSVYNVPQYSAAPSGPPVFDRDSKPTRIVESPTEIPGGVKFNPPSTDRSGRRRRESSPAALPSRSNVEFDLTAEQLDQEKRSEGRASRKSRRKSREVDAAAAAISQEPTIEERASKSKDERSSVDRRAEREAEIELELQRLYEEDRRQSEERRRRSESNAEYNEARRQSEDRTRRTETKGVAAAAAAVGAGMTAHSEETTRRTETKGVAAAAAAVGAGMAAAAIIEASRRSGEDEGDRRDDQKPRRRSSLKKSTSRDREREEDSPVRESQQERIARMVAQRVRSTPSPVHEDYGSFFVPPELAKDLEEHNYKSEHRDDVASTDPEIVEYVPRGYTPKKEKKETFDEFNYRVFGLDPNDDPKLFPWPVPVLELIEPSPPQSRIASPIDMRSPKVTPRDEVKDEVGHRYDDIQYEIVEPSSVSSGKKSRRSSVGSRVTWGDQDTYVYEVQTPEWERSGDLFDADGELAKVQTIYDEDSEPTKEIAKEVTLAQEATKKLSEELVLVKDFPDPPSNKIDVEIEAKSPVTPKVAPVIVEREPSFSSRRKSREDLEFATTLASAAAAISLDPSNVAEEPASSKEVSTSDPDPSSTLGSDKSFYESPFAETVSDLGVMTDNSAIPPRGGGHVEEKELPPAPEEEVVAKALETRAQNDSDSPPTLDGMVSPTRASRSEARRQERASRKTISEPSDAAPPPAPIPEPEQVTAPTTSGGFNVFDYLVEEKGQGSIPTASVMGRTAFSAKEAAEMARKKATRGSVIYAPLERNPSTVVANNEVKPTAAAKGLAALGAKEAAEKARKKSNRSSEIYAPLDENKSSQRDVDLDAAGGFSKLERAETFDQSKFKPAFDVQTPKSKSGYASDPEDWEKSSSSKRKSKKSSSSKRDSNGFPEKVAIVAAASAVSAPIIDDFYENKKSKRRSKRDSEIFDDDSKSVSSFVTDPRDEKRKSKDSGKKSGGFFGFFSSSKSDVSSSSARKSKSATSSEVGDQKKRKSKDSSSIEDDSASIISGRRRRSRSASQSSVKPPVRDESVEDGFVSAEEEALLNNGTENGERKLGSEKEESFLAQRPELPTPTALPMGIDGASGLNVEEEKPKLIGESLVKSDAEREMHDVVRETPMQSTDSFHSVPETAVDRERSVSPKTAPQPVDQGQRDALPASSPIQVSDARPRRLSNLRTADLASSPALISSPTAVPLHFRRLPISPGNVRTGSFGSPASPGSASSPLATPRLSRQGRPMSSDFRTSIKEFRPLYLVERHSSARQPTPEVEETYPSLPSSRTSSAHPSLENLRGDFEQDQEASPSQTRDDYFITPEHFRDCNRRQSYSYWHDEGERPKSAEDDYLDSGQATPTATSPQIVKREKEKPKYEFHSPSELLQDPSQFETDHPVEGEESLPLPSPLTSVAGTEDYVSARSHSRSVSPASEREPVSRSNSQGWRDAGLVALGGAAALVAGREALSNRSQEKEREEQMPTAPSLPSLPMRSEDREVQQASAPQELSDKFMLESPPKPSKKSKKDKKRGQDRRLESLPILATSNTVVREPSDQRDPELEPLTAVQSDPVERHEVEPSAEVVTEEPGERKVFVDEQLAEVRDLEPLGESKTVETEDAHVTDVVDETDTMGTLDEGSRKSSFPFNPTDTKHDGNIHPPADQDESRDIAVEDEPDSSTAMHTDRHQSFVPSIEEINKPENELGAFEEAFERARRARGLSGSTTREEALEGFLPRRDNAPFVEYGPLTPIEASPVATPGIEEAKEIGEEVKKGKKGKKGKKEKKDKKKGGKSSKLREVVSEDELDEGEMKGTEQETSDAHDLGVAATGVVAGASVLATMHDKNPFGDDFEIDPLQAVPPEQVKDETLARSDEPSSVALQDKNPFGDDFDAKSGAVETTKELAQVPEAEAEAEREEAETEPEKAETEPEKEEAEPEKADAEPEKADAEDTWASITTSKKGKKKNRKSQTPALFEDASLSKDEVSEPVDPEIAAVAEEPIKDIVKEIVAPSGKKSKKNKKKTKDLDWEGTPETGLEDSAPLVEDPPREVEAVPVSIEPEALHLTEPESTIPQEEDQPTQQIAEQDQYKTPSSSKKSKKSKKKSKVLDWEEKPDTATPGDSTPDVEESSRDMESIPTETPLEPDAIPESDSVTPRDEDQDQSAQLDDFTTPSSSKKSKKSKKKSKAVDQEEPIEEPEVATSSREDEIAPAPTVVLDVPTLSAEPQSIEDEQPVPTPTEQSDTANDFATSSSSKKGKKSKRKSKVAMNWEEPAAVATAAAAAVSVGVLASSRDGPQSEEDEWAAPTSKSSKKDKKSKKGKKAESVAMPDADEEPEAREEPAEIGPREEVQSMDHSYEHDDAHLDWLGRTREMAGEFPKSADIKATASQPTPESAAEMGNRDVDLETAADPYAHDTAHQEWLGTAGELATQFPDKSIAAGASEETTTEVQRSEEDPRAHDSSHQEWLGKAGELSAQFPDKSTAMSVLKDMPAETASEIDDPYAHDSAHQEWLGKANEIAAAFPDAGSSTIETSNAVGEKDIVTEPVAEDEKHDHDDDQQEPQKKVGEIATELPGENTATATSTATVKENDGSSVEHDKYAHDEAHQEWLGQAGQMAAHFPDSRGGIEPKSVPDTEQNEVGEPVVHDPYAHDEAHLEWLQQAHQTSSLFPDRQSADQQPSDTGRIEPETPHFEEPTEASIAAEVVQEPTAEEFAYSSGKKGKKDKKKSKKRASTVDIDDSSEIPTPTTAEAGRDVEEQSKDAEVATGTLVAGAAAALETDSITSTPFETPMERTDDFAWVPPQKKGKKEKKRKSLAWADEDVSTTDTGAGTPLAEKSTDFAEALTEEPAVDKDVEPQTEISADIVSEKPAEEVEEASWEPLSKKKSKKSRQSMSKLEDPVEQNSTQEEEISAPLADTVIPGSEPFEESKDVATTPSREEEGQPPVENVAEEIQPSLKDRDIPPTLEDAPSAPLLTEEPEEFAWSPSSKKKGKKDKKKRSSTLKDEVESSATATPQEESSIPATPAAEEVDEWALPSSTKGKKDKKKKSKKQSFAVDEEDEGKTPELEGEEAQVAEESRNVYETPGIEGDRRAPESMESVLEVPEDKHMPEEQEPVVAHDHGLHSPTEEEDQFHEAVEPSHDDHDVFEDAHGGSEVVESREIHHETTIHDGDVPQHLSTAQEGLAEVVEPSTVQEPETSTAPVVHDVMLQENVATTSPVLSEEPKDFTEQEAKTPAEPETEEYAYTTKKSKKDKKKRQSTTREQDLAPEALPAALIAGAAATSLTPEKETVSANDTSRDTSQAETAADVGAKDAAPPPEEEEWGGFTGKKGKKEKKKKRQSTVDVRTPTQRVEEDPMTESVAPEDISQPEGEASRNVPVEEDAVRDEVTEALVASQEPVDTPIEDEWSQTSKKSKKGKKSKRLSSVTNTPRSSQPDVDVLLAEADERDVGENIPATEEMIMQTEQTSRPSEAQRPLRHDVDALLAEADVRDAGNDVPVIEEQEQSVETIQSRRASEARRPSRHDVDALLAEADERDGTVDVPMIEEQPIETDQPRRASEAGAPSPHDVDALLAEADARDAPMNDKLPQQAEEDVDDSVSRRQPLHDIDVLLAEKKTKDISVDEEPSAEIEQLRDVPGAPKSSHFDVDALLADAETRDVPASVESMRMSVHDAMDRKQSHPDVDMLLVEAETKNSEAQRASEGEDVTMRDIDVGRDNTPRQSEEPTTEQDPKIMIASQIEAPDDEPLTYSAKKSKKDKKKKRGSTVDESMLSSGFATPAEEAPSEPLEAQTLNKEIHDAEYVLPTAAAAAAAAAAATATATESTSVETPRNIMEAAPAIDEETYSTGRKKSKKDKKKGRRQSTFDDLDATESQPITSLEDLSTAPTPSESKMEAETEPTVDVPVEEEAWASTNKKSKKDKKKGKRQSTFDDFETVESQSVTPLEDATSLQYAENKMEAEVQPVPISGSRDTTVEEEGKALAPTGKKSKKDKKKGKTLLAWEGGDEETSTGQPGGVETPVREEGEGETDPRRGPVDVTRGEEAVHPMYVDEGGAKIVVEDHRAVVPGEFPDEEPSVSRDVANEWSEPPKKSKKSKKEKKGRRSLAMDDEDGERIETIAEITSAEQASTPALDPHELASRQVEDGNSVDVAHHHHHHSHEENERRPETPPSDAGSSRERRRRRRSPIVFTGEEPDDLPGSRGLTGSTDHDAMNTALSVAAGLGLAGAAAGAIVQSSSKHEDERELSVGPRNHEASSSRREDERESPSLPDNLARSVSGEASGSKNETQEPSAWSFANLPSSKDLSEQMQNRDSGIQFADSPTLPQDRFQQTRDSGYVPSPATRSWHEPEAPSLHESSATRQRPPSPTSSSEDVREAHHRSVHHSRASEDRESRSHDHKSMHEHSRGLLETPGKRQPSPVDSTTKDRSSTLFDSSPSTRTETYGATPKLDTRYLPEPTADIHRSPSIHGHHKSREELRALGPGHGSSRSIGSEHHSIQHPPVLSSIHHDTQQPMFSPRHSREFSSDRPFSPPKTPLGTIHEHAPALSHSQGQERDIFASGAAPERHRSVHHEKPEHDLRAAAGLAGVAALGAVAVGEMGSSRDLPATSRAKSLGKSKSRTSSSRQLRSQIDPSNFASSSSHSLVDDNGKGSARDMADVFDGYGEQPRSPMSPTRPPSVRKRQSMQQIKDLEARVDQLANENRDLIEAKIAAERHLEDFHHDRSQSDYATQESLQAVNVQLREKDEDILKLREGLESLQQEVVRLTEVNRELTIAHETLSNDHEQRYSQLRDEHEDTHASWQDSTRELETLRAQHTELSAGMEDIVRHEIDTAMAEKNAEIEKLRGDLEAAKEKIRELQQQILTVQPDDVIVAHDEDYFDNSCQQLCQYVQQWVLRFSKFSDTRICRLTNEVRDEKIVDRFDNAILDGSDVDIYLGDRVKRRDVFMSVVMTMIWEFIFTRYLFGMDREQRQKLKQLEKQLGEVGPPSAVHQWRAMTLTLLAKRDVFKTQRESDTEAVAGEIFATLSRFLPPPSHLEKQIRDSLRNVMRAAVELSIEMRTQRAEYIMLPPLQPEYDTNGDLARKVYFNASLMNERSGLTSSNEELETGEAVVRIVLFPLVVKKGGLGEDGEWLGDEEVVVCPAQVLVARAEGEKEKIKRAVSSAGGRISGDQRDSLRAASRGSVASFVSNGNSGKRAASAVETGVGNMI